MSETNGRVVLDPEARAYYLKALDILEGSGVPFLVGGAYALQCYTGITRHTKDFDVFVRPEDAERVLKTFAAAGYRTDLTFPHWLGKVFHGDNFIDVIYSSGNGVAQVDPEWFDHAEPAELMGREVKVCPVEEIIWSKSFVMERERYDGADVNHLIRGRGRRLDWDRLLRRFGRYWRVLFNHLVMFGFVYPGELSVIPTRVMEELTRRLLHEQRNPPPDRHVCQGTIISREQYLIDIDEWHYQDARLLPGGSSMTAEDVAQWTAAI